MATAQPKPWKREDFARMSEQSHFGACRIDGDGFGVAVRFAKQNVWVA